MPNAGQKGSDASAREATRKLVAATRQLHSLQQVLDALHSKMASAASPDTKPPARRVVPRLRLPARPPETPRTADLTVGKNTLVGLKCCAYIRCCHAMLMFCNVSYLAAGGLLRSSHGQNLIVCHARVQLHSAHQLAHALAG